MLKMYKLGVLGDGGGLVVEQGEAKLLLSFHKLTGECWNCGRRDTFLEELRKAGRAAADSLAG